MRSESDILLSNPLFVCCLVRALWLEKLAKLHAQARVIQCKLGHQDASEMPSPKDKWSVFYRQQQAFDAARNELDNAIVFCFQDPEANGQRKYLVSTQVLDC